MERGINHSALGMAQNCRKGNDMLVHDILNNWDIEFSDIPTHRIESSLDGEDSFIACKNCNEQIRFYKTGDITKWECGCPSISEAAAAMGRKGGSARSSKKTAAVRENARKPRPGRKAKPFTHALVINRSAPFGEIGDIVSRHTSQDLAEKAARKSGYDEFLKIDEISTP